MKASEWAERLRTYGKTFVEAPGDDYEGADVVPIDGSEGRAWSVWYRLHSVEDGQSDLQLALTVRYEGSDDVAIDSDDLHVA